MTATDELLANNDRYAAEFIRSSATPASVRRLQWSRFVISMVLAGSRWPGSRRAPSSPTRAASVGSFTT
jgi:hypothetical protein